MCCSVLQCVAVVDIHKQRHCVLQCVAMCCSVLQCVAVCCTCGYPQVKTLCVAVCCSVLQCVAVCLGISTYMWIYMHIYAHVVFIRVCAFGVCVLHECGVSAL